MPHTYITSRNKRFNDPHGGVAIYVKNNLFCKPRPDLQVNGLEAVWVETKINQEDRQIAALKDNVNKRFATIGTLPV